MSDLHQASVTQLGDMLSEGKVSARELAQAHLERIDELNGKVNAVIELNPDALAIAEASDEARAAGKSRGRLEGIPVLIKDNIATADRMTTTAGSLALEGSIAPEEAPVAAALRAAGAVILGKTNLSEWANFRSRRSSSGWSSRGGQTRNPYALDRTPGGSSSGSAVAVSASFCSVAIGTETDGSIVSPAAMNGIVGIKPTLGQVSGKGIIPIAHSQDTAGPMARSVADAALLLAAISTGPSVPPETLDPGGLRGKRIGVARAYSGFNDAVDRVLETALDAIRQAGGEVIDEIPLPTPEEIRPHEFEAMLYEFKAGLNAHLEGLGETAPVRSLAEIIAFNQRHRDRTMPYFPQDILESAAEKGSLDEPAYLDALAAAKRLTREQGIDAAITAHRLDAIVAPTNCTPWLIDWVNGDNRSGGSSGPAAVAGYPNITVPMGRIRGLPVGLSFFSTAEQDPALIRMAHAFECETQIRIAPDFRESVVF